MKELGCLLVALLLTSNVWAVDGVSFELGNGDYAGQLGKIPHLSPVSQASSFLNPFTAAAPLGPVDHRAAAQDQ